MYVSTETINKFKQLDCIEVTRPCHVTRTQTCYMTRAQYKEYLEHIDTLESIDMHVDPQKWNAYSNAVHFYFSHIFKRQNPNFEKEYVAALISGN